jgi:cytochrome c oxidase subunit IV
MQCLLLNVVISAAAVMLNSARLMLAVTVTALWTQLSVVYAIPDYDESNRVLFVEARARTGVLQDAT